MMKEGRIVALDSTARLLADFSERVLRVKLDRATLPASLAAVAPRAMPRARGAFPIADVAARRAGASRAARGGRGGREPRGRRAGPRGRVREDHAPRRPARRGMTGFPTLLHKEVLRFWKVSFQTVAAPVLTALLYLLVFAHALAGARAGLPRRAATLQFLIPGLVMMSDAAERVRQQLVVAHPVEDHRQHRVHPAAAARRRSRSSSPTCARPSCAATVVGPRRVAVTALVRPRAAGASAVGARLRGSWARR